MRPGSVAGPPLHVVAEIELETEAATFGRKLGWERHAAHRADDPAPALEARAAEPPSEKGGRLAGSAEHADREINQRDSKRSDGKGGGLGRGKTWSGQRDLNPRPSAWEADTLPLSYARSHGVCPISG